MNASPSSEMIGRHQTRRIGAASGQAIKRKCSRFAASAGDASAAACFIKYAETDETEDKVPIRDSDVISRP